jgi:hypothetical protein
MKRIVCLVLCCVIYQLAFNQSTTAYNAYLQNLCTCLQKDTIRVKSMNDASAVMGNCLTAVDTLLRNKAMKEKKLFKTDVESLEQFEKIAALDLLRQCPAFEATMEKLSNAAPRKTPERLPILDTIAANACRCLERKGVAADKDVVVKNLQDCMGASIILHFDELHRQYRINDQNQEILSSLGEMVTQMVITNCTFFARSLKPVISKQEKNN